MKTEDKILNFLKYSGPSLTMKIANNIKENSIIASAYLSELSSQRKIKISNLKIGTSPLYYLPGQEDQLIKFTKDINPKDREVLERLHKKKVLRENNLELLAKVALRSLKDFAIPLHVNFNGQKELFWRWHLLSDEETNQIISEMLGTVNQTNNVQPTEQPQTPTQTELQEKVIQKEEIIEKEAQKTKVEVKEEIKQEHVVEKQTQFESYPPNTAQNQNSINSSHTYPPNTAITGRGGVVEQPKPVEEVKKVSETKVSDDAQKPEVSDKVKVEIKSEPKKVESNESVPEFKEEVEKKEDIKEVFPETKTELPKVEKPIVKEEKGQTKLSEVKDTEEDKSETKPKVEVKEEKPEKKNEPKEADTKKEDKKIEPKVSDDIQKDEDQEKPRQKKSLMSKIKDKLTGKYKKKIEKGFLDKVVNYLDSLDIKIENKEIVRKNSELNFIISVPSTIGRIKYYCKAKNKNRCDEKDLSAAYMESQMKKMPLLFLYSSDINKKAIEMIESDAFDNLIIKRIDRDV